MVPVLVGIELKRSDWLQQSNDLTQIKYNRKDLFDKNNPISNHDVLAPVDDSEKVDGKMALFLVSLLCLNWFLSMCC